MRIFYLHGMGGNPGDWEAVSALAPGTALPLPRGLSFEETAGEIARPLSTWDAGPG